MRNDPMGAGCLRDIDSDRSRHGGAAYSRYVAYLVLSLSAAVPPIAAAQQSEAAEPTALADRLEEVVVTARKQTETLLDVPVAMPVAITAFSEASLPRVATYARSTRVCSSGRSSSVRLLIERVRFG